MVGSDLVISEGVAIDPEWLDIDAAGTIAAEFGLHAHEARLAPARSPGVLDNEVGFGVLASRALPADLVELDDLFVVAAVSAVVCLWVPVSLAAARWRASISAASQLAGSHNDGRGLVVIVWNHGIVGSVIGSTISVVGGVVGSTVSVIGGVVGGVVSGRGWDVGDNGDTVIDSLQWAGSGIKKTSTVVVEVRVLSLDTDGDWSILELVDDVSGTSVQLTVVGYSGNLCVVAGCASCRRGQTSRDIWVIRSGSCAILCLIGPVKELKTSIASAISEAAGAVDDLLLGKMDWSGARLDCDHTLEGGVSREGVARSACSLILHSNHLVAPIVGCSGAAGGRSWNHSPDGVLSLLWGPRSTSLWKLSIRVPVVSKLESVWVARGCSFGVDLLDVVISLSPSVLALFPLGHVRVLLAVGGCVGGELALLAQKSGVGWSARSSTR